MSDEKCPYGCGLSFDPLVHQTGWEFYECGSMFHIGSDEGQRSPACREIARLRERDVPCKWQYTEGVYENGAYETDCEQVFLLIDGTVEDNEYKFCPGCGHPIEANESPQP